MSSNESAMKTAVMLLFLKIFRLNESSFVLKLAMSRSVENLNRDSSSCFDERDKESGAKEPRPSLASGSSLTISSDTDVARRRFIFVRNRGWSTITSLPQSTIDGLKISRQSPEGNSSDTVTEVVKKKKVSGYLRELVSYTSKVSLIINDNFKYLPT